MDGSTISVATVAAARPPITARPNGAVASAPSPSPNAIGTMPAIIAALVIRTGRMRARAASIAACNAVPACGRKCSANVTSRIAFATATPVAMMAPMNDSTFNVVRVKASIKTTPINTAGTVDTTTKASRNDWKFADSSRKMTTTATARPTPMLVSVTRIEEICPRTVTLAPRGGAPARAIASSMRVAARPRSLPLTFADNVTIR
jgi:hypothetical protein